MDRRNKSRLRLFPKQGYILMLIGILIGFMVFLAISSLISQGGGGGAEQEGLPSSISFTFLYTSEKDGWIKDVTPAFEDWFFERFGIKEIAIDSTSLVLSPVVIGGWASFFEENNVNSFKDLYQLAEAGIDYKYGHPDPQLSNGGAMAEVLEFAYALEKKPEEFNIDDLKIETAKNFVKVIESKAVMYGKSTGFFGRWAAENGPSAIDCFTVYESVIISNSEKATQKWGNSLVAVYPEDGTLLSDHPFVILNAPWVSAYQKFAASQYLFYLLQEQNQDTAQEYGFRPANPNVPLNEEIFNITNGVEFEIKVPTFRPLSGEVMEALFTVWSDVKNPGV